MNVISSSASGIRPIYHLSLVDIFSRHAISLPPNINRASFLSVGVYILKYRNSLSISSIHISQSLSTDRESFGLNCFIGKFHSNQNHIVSLWNARSMCSKHNLSYLVYFYLSLLLLVLCILCYPFNSCLISSLCFLFILPDALVSLIYHCGFYFPQFILVANVISQAVCFTCFIGYK